MARWLGRQFPAFGQRREIIVLDLGMRRHRYGSADRSEQVDHMERQVIVKGAFADFNDTIPLSHSAKFVRSIIGASLRPDEFSDCTFYILDARRKLLPLKSLDCNEARLATE